MIKPESLYSEAMSTFRHYDTLSTTVTAGIPVLLAGVVGLIHTLDPSSWRWLVAIVGILLTWALFLTYSRLDLHAGTALKVAATIERGEAINGKEVKGLASVREELASFPQLVSSPGGKIYLFVSLMTATSIVAQLILIWICIFSIK